MRQAASTLCGTHAATTQSLLQQLVIVNVIVVSHGVRNTLQVLQTCYMYASVVMFDLIAHVTCIDLS